MNPYTSDLEDEGSNRDSFPEGHFTITEDFVQIESNITILSRYNIPNTKSFKQISSLIFTTL